MDIVSLAVAVLSVVLALRAERRAGRAEQRAIAAERTANALAQRPQFRARLVQEGSSDDVPFLLVENVSAVDCSDLTVTVQPAQGYEQAFELRGEVPWRLALLRAGGQEQHPIRKLTFRGGRVLIRYQYLDGTGALVDERRPFDVSAALWLRTLRAITLTSPGGVRRR